jgi:hypothetical protein
MQKRIDELAGEIAALRADLQVARGLLSGEVRELKQGERHAA